MNRREFALASGATLFSSLGVSSLVQRPALGLEFEISSVPDRDPTNVESVLIEFSKIDLMPRYLDESDGIDLTVDIEINGTIVRSKSKESIDFTNGEILDKNDIGPLSIGEIPIDTTSSSVNGNVHISVNNSRLRRKEYTQGFSINSLSEIRDGLVSRWKMENGSGSLLIDSQGPYDGELQGPSWDTTSKQGEYSLDFNRSNSDRVLLNNGNDLSNYSFRDTGFTVTQWVYPYTTGNSRHGLFSANDSNNWWNSRIESNGKYEFWYGSNGQNPNTQTDSSPPTDQWSHFAATVDPNDYTVKVYYNGSFENSDNTGDTPNYKQFSNPTLGSRSNDNYVNAKIDDVRIYDRVLSESEINRISNLNG